MKNKPHHTIPIKVDFNRPYFTGKELTYIRQAVKQAHISGDGLFTKKCQEFFIKKFDFASVLLTTSCTDALEMTSLLVEINMGDEVIVPSFTFVSTANAFALRGATLVFADSCSGNPNMDVSLLESLITRKTKAIVPVHYAGIACEMDPILKIAAKYNLAVIEDAAQSIDSYYVNPDGSKKPLGSIGHLAAFSFHETKNITCGEGGMLVINKPELFLKRAEIIREKGTNRSAFFRGEVDKYSWVDVGSSYLPSDILAAFLWAQLEHLQEIQQQRLNHWRQYYKLLEPLQKKGMLYLPEIPTYATNNAHMFYIVCNSSRERTRLREYLLNNGIYAVSHYLPLHQSPYMTSAGKSSVECPRASFFAGCLLRLPLYCHLKPKEIKYVSAKVKAFYQ